MMVPGGTALLRGAFLMTYGGWPGRRDRVHAPTLWVGGAVTTVAAALIAVLGADLARILFDAPVLAPPSGELLGEAPSVRLANLAAVAAVAATALAYLLLLTAQPMALLSWLVALASTVGVVWPYATTATPATQTATSLVNLCVGTVIGAFVTSVATRAAIRVDPPDITPRSTY